MKVENNRLCVLVVPEIRRKCTDPVRDKYQVSSIIYQLHGGLKLVRCILKVVCCPNTL